MGFYDNSVVPYIIELGCGLKSLEHERKAATAGLRGTVLEIGFGSGLNIPHLPREVTRLLAVDPSERARRIGRERIEAATCLVEFVGLNAEVIDAGDASADAALCTFTLCTIPAHERALHEVRRILKPGARLHFLEHGRAPDAAVARWQNRLNGLQRTLAGGCNLTRDVPALLEASGFTLETLDRRYAPGLPRTHAFLYSGVASVP